MIKNRLSTNKIKQLEKQLAKYQSQYDELRQQSPDRWWHDEHFDNQLRVLEAVIEETEKQLMEFKKRLSKGQMDIMPTSSLGQNCPNSNFLSVRQRLSPATPLRPKFFRQTVLLQKLKIKLIDSSGHFPKRKSDNL